MSINYLKEPVELFDGWYKNILKHGISGVNDNGKLKMIASSAYSNNFIIYNHKCKNGKFEYSMTTSFNDYRHSTVLLKVRFNNEFLFNIENINSHYINPTSDFHNHISVVNNIVTGALASSADKNDKVEINIFDDSDDNTTLELYSLHDDATYFQASLINKLPSKDIINALDYIYKNIKNVDENYIINFGLHFIEEVIKND